MLNGDDFEARSEQLLKDYGMTILARQYRCKLGEIDLIAKDEHRLLFVEVRARQHRGYGGAAGSVNRSKQCKLVRCAAYFLSRHPQWRHLPCRFDVIAWEPGPGTPGRLRRKAGQNPGQSPHQRWEPHPEVRPEQELRPLEARWIQAAFLA